MLLVSQLKRFLNTRLYLALKHKETIKTGRTHVQHALPITYKIAIWEDELGKHLERFYQGKERNLVNHFAGPAGTLHKLEKMDLMCKKNIVKF